MIEQQAITFALFMMEPASGSDVRLTVSEGNGLVAFDDGQPCPGRGNLLAEEEFCIGGKPICFLNQALP